MSRDAVLVAAEGFAREVIRPRAQRMARGDDVHFPRDILEEAAKRGLTGLLVPREYGGTDAGHVAFAHLIEAVARECASSAVILDVHVSVATEPIVIFGNEEQKRRYLPRLATGEWLGAFALTEAGSGSDAAALRTTATRNADGSYILNGSKAFITNAGAADVYVVMARTGHTPGAGSISAFLVEASTPGVKPQPPLHKMGLRGSWTAELVLDDVVVPGQNMLAGEGQGFHVAMSSLDSGRIGISAQATGIAQGALDAATAHRAAHQFTSTLADMDALTAASRALYRHAAEMCDAQQPFTREAAAAKLYATDAAMQVAHQAVELCAPDSQSEDHPAAIRVRDAKACQIYEGTNQVQRIVLARHLLKT
ncbi:MAG TPA: acyl-CoA dehydrogenase family protein [Candidatus Angelobacter sp.]|nr:acyl-CoA dehydrogenase family protein [Candidatus Angelobacter sp.]